jgi:hypothetical protein
MNRSALWKVGIVVVSMIAVAGIATLTTHSFAGGSPGNVAGSARVEAPAPQESAQGGETAACRRAPECSIDSDCNLLCGVGLGKCVHSNCPVRICKCH